MDEGFVLTTVPCGYAKEGYVSNAFYTANQRANSDYMTFSNGSESFASTLFAVTRQMWLHMHGVVCSMQ